MSETASSDEPQVTHTHERAVPEEATKHAPREYVVLKAWTEHSRVMAHSRDEAVRKAYATGGSDGGTELVALTARSFVPRKVAVETKTQLVLS